MDAGAVLCGVGVAAGFGCGAGAASLACVRLRRVGASAQARTPGAAGIVERLARGGVPALLPAARVLLRAKPLAALVQEGVWLAGSRGVTTDSQALLSVVMLAIAAVSLLAALLAGSALAAAAVACCACACLAAWARGVQDRRRDELRDAIPEALKAMGVCFRSGYSLQQTFDQVAGETEGSLSRLFRRAAHRLEVGQGSARALAVLHEEATVPELAFVAVALDVQHQAGGSMQPVLDAACETVEGQIELSRSLRVQTAQAQLSARVVSVMPFVLVAILSLMDSDFLSPFFESVTGMVLLGLALGMEAAGVVLVRRMLRVEVS